jgi:hypothetical protein
MPMPQFECPSCRKLCETASEFAGKFVVCPQCGQGVTVPHDAAAITADAPIFGVPNRNGNADEALRERSIIASGVRQFWIHSGWTTVIVVVMFATLVALLIPAVLKVREAAARTQSINNLKQLGLAMHGFHDANKRLPFNGSDIAPPKATVVYSRMAIPMNKESGCWYWQISPYVESGPFFSRINATVSVPVLQCPGRGRPGVEISNVGGGAWSDYFFNNYINDPLRAADPAAPDLRRNLKDITDGTSFTIMLGHGNIDTRQYASDSNVTLCSNIFMGGTTGTMRAGDNGRTNPTGVTLQRDSAEAPTIGSWGGPFSGALMCMGDATVRTFPYTTLNFSAFLTPTGGENLGPPD